MLLCFDHWRYRLLQSKNCLRMLIGLWVQEKKNWRSRRTTPEVTFTGRRDLASIARHHNIIFCIHNCTYIDSYASLQGKAQSYNGAYYDRSNKTLRKVHFLRCGAIQ